MPTETPKGKGKGKSKKRTADESTNLALKDFKIEYSKSSRATCKHCEIKICKVRSCLMIYFCKYNFVKKYCGYGRLEHIYFCPTTVDS